VVPDALAGNPFDFGALDSDMQGERMTG
jgi:hypothetical protein